MKKIISLILVFSLLVLPLTAFANKPDHARGNGNSVDKWTEKELRKGHKDDNDQMDNLEALILNIEMSLSIVEKEEDFVDLFPELTKEMLIIKLAELKEELASITLRDKDVKKELLRLRKELRTLVRNRYTSDELALYQELKKELEEKYYGIKVLDVDSIVSKNINIKFEGMPPVIKGGRTLIPVAALVKGFGANVSWNETDKSVLIWTDDNDNGVLDVSDMDIIIFIGSNTAYVNGIPVLIDAKAELMNNRTIVPLRFIAETLHLKVKWNPEDETIEIDDADTTLTVTGNGYSIVGTKIIVPEGSSRQALDEALTPAENGSYTLEDGNDNLLGIDVTPLLLTDVVVSLAENGYTEETYTLEFPATETLITVNEPGFSINGLVVTMPEGTTRNMLSNLLTLPENALLTLKDLNDLVLPLSDDDMLNTDKIIVTAADGLTTATYTITFASEDTLLTSIDVEFELNELVITVPYMTTLESFKLAIEAAEKGRYEIYDVLDVLLETDRELLETDYIKSIAQDEVTFAIYTIDIALNNDVSLIVDGDLMDLIDETIYLPQTTTRNILNAALTAPLNGSYDLEDGLSNVLAYDETIILESNVVVVTAENGDQAIYKIKYLNDDTELTSIDEDITIVDEIITVPFATSRLTLDAALEPAEFGSYQLEDNLENPLGLDVTPITNSDIVRSTAQDTETEVLYSIVVLPASTDAVISVSSNFSLNDFIISIPNPTTREELLAGLVLPEGATVSLNDFVLIFDDTEIVDADKLFVTAQDGITILVYTLKY